MFDTQQVIATLKQWLSFGETSFDESGLVRGKGHKGYFSGSGFAATCLRDHIENLAKSGLNSPNERLPEPNQYVLIHLTVDNWGDLQDPTGNRYWRVAKFVKGMSVEERDALDDTDPSKRTYCGADVWGNNRVPYCWNEFGPSNHFGQDVDFWQPLPGL